MFNYNYAKEELKVIDEAGLANETLYYYDVNSLYPFCMLHDVPVGRPIAFEGDIRAVEPEAAGFFYCKIETTAELLHPILQRRVKSPNNTIRTIAGLGSWTGWVYSREIDFLESNGYKFEILKGYQFKLDSVFKGYIEDLYKLRQEFSKDNPMNLIAKLLMNSLYGKFGMHQNYDQVHILKIDELTSLAEKISINGKYFDVELLSDYVHIDDEHVIVVIKGAHNSESEDDVFHGSDINIAIASSITALGRLYMARAKNSEYYKLYYSDTDSIVINKELPESEVGKEIGKFKLEYVIKKAIFIAPKVYGLITSDGTEVIKVKGVRSEYLKDFHIDDLTKMLVKGYKIKVTNQKWYKDIYAGTIRIDQQVYNLQVTNSKRKPVYVNINGSEIYSDSKPFYYSELE